MQLVVIEVALKDGDSTIRFTQTCFAGSELDLVHGIILGANSTVINSIKEIKISYPENIR